MRRAIRCPQDFKFSRVQPIVSDFDKREGIIFGDEQNPIDGFAARRILPIHRQFCVLVRHVLLNPLLPVEGICLKIADFKPVAAGTVRFGGNFNALHACLVLRA